MTNEHEFMKFVVEHGNKVPSEFWPTLTKRQLFLLEKWADEGLWDYAASCRSGWLTPDGVGHYEKRAAR